MQITFWGVRGSIPTPGAATAGIGGNTSCVEVRAGGQVLIFDGGTGLRSLGEKLMLEAPLEAHIFFSHVHWDHIQGFPFFAPAFEAGNTIRLYGGVNPSHTLERVLSRQMSSPHFPVRLGDMAASLTFCDLPEGQAVHAGGAVITNAPGNHPNGVFAYRVDAGGKSVVYATDTEHYAVVDGRLAQLCRGADVLIYDAQYTPEEYAGGVDRPARTGWGHSTFAAGTELARAAGVHQLVLFHHDPSHSDADVLEKERRCRVLFPNSVAAREGMTIDLSLRFFRYIATRRRCAPRCKHAQALRELLCRFGSFPCIPAWHTGCSPRQSEELTMPTRSAVDALGAYRAKLGGHPPLAEERERELARSWREGDKRAGDALVCACLPFVISIASEYRRWGIPLEDIVQQGNIGLLRAAARFDPTKNCRLITYAAYWIRAEIRDYVVRAYRVVRIGTTKGERRALRLYRTTREDDPVRLAEGSGLTEARAISLLPLLTAGDVSLDGTGPSGVPVADRLASALPSPEDDAASRESDDRARTALATVLAELTPRERRIVSARWGVDDPTTLEMLGRELGVSKERVRQLEERARAKLRTRLEALGYAGAA